MYAIDRINFLSLSLSWFHINSMSIHSNKEENNITEEDKSFHSTDEEYDEEEITEDDDTEDDDDQDEPKLRYRRVGASLKEILEKDTASTLRVSERFVVNSMCILMP